MFNFKTLSFGLLFAGLGSVTAQTAPGFPVSSSSQTLRITYGTNVVSPAGELIPRADVLNPPNITTPIWTSTGRGVLIVVDSDVPRNGTRMELLHWLVSNVTVSPGNTSALIFPPSGGEAPYRAPNPPVGDIPHAYTFILFSQPEDFAVPAQFTNVLQTRLPFNVSAFVQAARLGQGMAANYIRVQNLTGTPTTTYPPPRATNGTGPSPSAVPSPGAANELGGGRYAWVGVGMAMLAGLAAFTL